MGNKEKKLSDEWFDQWTQTDSYLASDNHINRIPLRLRSTNIVIYGAATLSEVLKEFEHLLAPKDYNRIKKEFKAQIKLLLKEVLNSQDKNYHTPLHISSFFGDFKASTLFTQFGANAASAATAEAPLEVSKDKFAR